MWAGPGESESAHGSGQVADSPCSLTRVQPHAREAGAPRRGRADQAVGHDAIVGVFGQGGMGSGTRPNASSPPPSRVNAATWATSTARRS